MPKRNRAQLIIAAVAVPVLVAAWFGYWALARETTEQRYRVNQGTTQYQSALISAQRDRVTAHDLAGNPDQRAAIAAQFCAVAMELTHTPADLSLAQSRICAPNSEAYR